MSEMITGILIVIVSMPGASSPFVVYPARIVAYLKHMWFLLLFLLVAEGFSSVFSALILGGIATIAAREDYGLTAIRPQDKMVFQTHRATDVLEILSEGSGTFSVNMAGSPLTAKGPVCGEKVGTSLGCCRCWPERILCDFQYPEKHRLFSIRRTVKALDIKIARLDNGKIKSYSWFIMPPFIYS